LIDQNQIAGAPLVTIGITCYNAEDTIGRAIASALGQDWPNIEVIVVDDRSSDGSSAIIQDWASREPRLRVHLHERNQGAAAARNSAVHLANGEFIAWFDDDDESRSDRIRVQCNLLRDYMSKTGAETVLCYCSGVRRYPNGYELPLLAVGSQPAIPVGETMANHLLFFARRQGVYFGGGTPTCSLMGPADVFEKVGGFDENLRRQEDADFAVRAAFIGCHFIGTSEPLLLQFATVGADKSSDAEYESFVRLLDKNRDYLTAKGVYRYMRGWAAVRRHHFNRQPWSAVLALLCLFARYPFRTTRHFVISAPRRWRHERRMRAYLVGQTA
jgi:glycosyltransferase involved in cell wall biosynthesis